MDDRTFRKRKIGWTGSDWHQSQNQAHWTFGQREPPTMARCCEMRTTQVKGGLLWNAQPGPHLQIQWNKHQPPTHPSWSSGRWREESKMQTVIWHTPSHCNQTVRVGNNDRRADLLIHRKDPWHLKQLRSILRAHTTSNQFNHLWIIWLLETLTPGRGLFPGSIGCIQATI